MIKLDFLHSSVSGCALRAVSHHKSLFSALFVSYYHSIVSYSAVRHCLVFLPKKPNFCYSILNSRTWTELQPIMALMGFLGTPPGPLAQEDTCTSLSGVNQWTSKRTPSYRQTQWCFSGYTEGPMDGTIYRQILDCSLIWKMTLQIQHTIKELFPPV